MAADLTRGGMYAVIPATVLYDDELRPTAKLLYGEIVRLAQANGYCFATNKAFCRICGCSESTVTNLLAELKQHGHIRVKLIRRNGKTGDIVQRRIFVGQALTQDDPDDEEESAGGMPENWDTSPRNLGEGMPENWQPIKCIKNTRDKNTPITPREIGERLSEYAADDRELKEAILGLLENRQKANGKPVKTLRAMNGILRDLDKLSGGSRAVKLAMLDNAIKKNWLTVYALKPDEIPQAGPPADERRGRFL